MAKRTIEQIDVAGKRVLIRVDFNVPLDSAGRITDDRRIERSLPTIRSVLDRGGRPIVMSHFGRPAERGYEADFSLKPAADRLGELLDGVEVTLPGRDCVGADAAEAVASIGAGQVVVLENLRFHKGEQSNDRGFAAKLAAYGDVYCNDAFGAAHRDHASMVAVPEAMADRPRVAGLLLNDELKYLDDVINSPRHPFVAVLGGAKVSDKIGVIGNLMGRVDTILVGGAMAYTFCKALGQNVGSSLVQLGMLGDASKIIDAAGASPTDLVLPTDHVCGKQVTQHTPVRVHRESIPDGWMGLDIGPDTASSYTATLRKAKTIVWNGPMGVFEVPPFDVGTRQIAQAVAEATDGGATSVAGGGDTAAAIEALGLAGRISHVSTGGGASLELLEGRRFRSVALLDEA